MFATHYHPGSREADKCLKIAPIHRAANIDEKTQEMTFLYRFLPGLCPASHGHNVARLAGLPKSVLQEAAAKSAEFEKGSGENQAASTKLSEIASLAAKGDEAALRALFRSGI